MGTPGGVDSRFRGNDGEGNRSRRVGKRSETRLGSAGRSSALSIAKKLDAKAEKEARMFEPKASFRASRFGV